jgi:glycosyltransferase involved in cell wall biosynthesis
VWSGTHYSIYRSLKNIGDVEILGPYEPVLRKLVMMVWNQLSLRLTGKRVSYRHSRFLSKGYANYFNSRLKHSNFDFIIAPAASCEMAYVETSIPIIYITDGTFGGCINYHKSLRNLTERSVKEGHEIERLAISKCTQLIVSSAWAAHSAEIEYGSKKEKIHILPYGANLESIPLQLDISKEIPQIWKLLFVGVYWEDKGGDIVYDCFLELLKKGFPVELTVVGCQPEHGRSHPKMKVIPFIDKNDPEGQKQLADIYQEHHFLLLPTRFDCTPIVINEASAFGVPVIAPRTGGVEGHLKNHENGCLADYNDKGEKYAEIIETYLKDPQMYLLLRKSTRKLYEDQLNWEKWTLSLKKILGL